MLTIWIFSQSVYEYRHKAACLPSVYSFVFWTQFSSVRKSFRKSKSYGGCRGTKWIFKILSSVVLIIAELYCQILNFLCNVLFICFGKKVKFQHLWRRNASIFDKSKMGAAEGCCFDVLFVEIKWNSKVSEFVFSVILNPRNEHLSLCSNYILHI